MSEPEGDGLSNLPLYERVQLARKEADRLMKIKSDWDPLKGGQLPLEVLDSLHVRYGLRNLTEAEYANIDLNDRITAIEQHARAIIESAIENGLISRQNLLTKKSQRNKKNNAE